MLPRRRDPRTVVAAATGMALMFAPEFALAQQSNAPPAQIGNRVDHQERQPSTAEICASGRRESVDCSPQTGKELEQIRREIGPAEQAHPDADHPTTPLNGTR
jgi:hypothetical protein